MGKIRVHELAKELKMENKDLLKILEKMEMGVKTVHSTLEEEDAERVKNQISFARKEGVVEQRVKPTVIRRRVVREEVPPPAPEIPSVPPMPTPEVPQETAPPAAKPAEKIEKTKVEVPLTPRPEEIELPAAPEIPAAPESVPPLATAAETEAQLPPGPAPLEAPEVPAPGETLKEKVVAPPGIVPEAAAQVAPTTPPVEPPPRPAARPHAPGVPVEKPRVPEKAPERPAVKPSKKKHEPAKIIERPATSPAFGARGVAKAPIIFPSAPGTTPKAPVILQRPAPAKPATEEEEKGRRRKKFKRDVEVLEEGKETRVRIITTKKRTFKEYNYQREDRGGRAFTLDQEPRARTSRSKGMTKTELTVPKAIKRKIRISEAILVGELAKRMGVKASEVIRRLMELGLMVSINQAIDADAASLVATDFGYEVEKTGLEIEDLIEEKEERAEDLVPRPPVVTIMGHVDHGKTSLLDAIRQTNVTAGEAGGITQHIGAYEVEVDHRRVVFLDTPGHEAFTAMRARGAQVTDIVILVVAADDGVQNQTTEAINHAKAAKVPIIVAINKIDKPTSNPERVKQALTEYGLVPEAWGGETIFAEVSAKQKLGLKELLEMILLQAEVLELKANSRRAASGAIIEAKLDKGRGAVATVLVQNGTLHVGDAFVVGSQYGHVRAMINDRGERIESAGPSTPVEVIGFSGVPNAGDAFVMVTDERRAKELATQRMQKQRELELSRSSKVTLEDFFKKMQKGVVKDLNLILKADVQGSIEALSEALNRLSTDAVKVSILHSGVGDINESDCMLASASEAIILGFNVGTEPSAQEVADRERIDIRLYKVIYDALDDVRKAMEGLLEPIYEEKFLGRAEVRVLFHISRLGVIAGSYVKEGKIVRGARARLIRGGQLVHEGTVVSLKIQKDDQREVAAGFECGINLGDYRDIQVNDIVECYTVEKKTAQL